MWTSQLQHVIQYKKTMSLVASVAITKHIKTSMYTVEYKVLYLYL